MGNICSTGDINLFVPSHIHRRHTNRCIQDFEVVSYLGTGGFGKVLLVEERNTGRLFALKVVKRAKLSLPSFQALQFIETKVLTQLASPFIVKLHYSFSNESKWFMIQDFLPGGTLFSLLRKLKRLPERVVQLYCAEIVLGLEALHTASVIYRDLKPENILLDDRGHLKLADFNLAKLVDGNRSFAGTAEYVAPEVIRAEQQTPSLDYWSLGVVLYELLCGFTPFSSTNLDELYIQITSKPPEFPI